MSRIKEERMSFSEIKHVKFELNNAFTWGVVRNDKYGGFSIHIVVNGVTEEEIEMLASEHGSKSPLYGAKARTLYLRCKKLTDKRVRELLDEGRNRIEVHFDVIGTYKNDGGKYLSFKTLKLRKIENLDEDCPED